jgi:hypothetical protein
MRWTKRYPIVGLMGLVFLALYSSDVRHVGAQATCQFTPFADTILYHAPILDPTQQKDILPAGKGYPVQLQAPQYLYIAIDDAYGGFVDRQAGTLSGECGMNVPVDSQPLHTYPTVCILLSSADARPVFEDDQLQKQIGIMRANGSYAVTRRTATSTYLYGTGWVAADSGQLSGNCDILRSPAEITAVALENARVWSEPNVRLGQQLASLKVGAQVRIIAGPVRGFIRLDSQVEGSWYQIKAAESIPTGWVWSERLAFAGSMWRASVRNDARIWSAPDAKTGRSLITVAPGTVISVLSGPVRGSIRLDSDIQGNWYQVQTMDFLVTGWMWDSRLVFTTHP